MMRGSDVIICSFEHAGEILRVYNPYLSGRFTELHDDTPITDATMMNVYGLYQLEEFFRILQLDSDNMQLESDKVRLTFRKYWYSIFVFEYVRMLMDIYNIINSFSLGNYEFP